MLLYVTGEPQLGVPDLIAAGIAGCWAGSVMNSPVSAECYMRSSPALAGAQDTAPGRVDTARRPPRSPWLACERWAQR